MHTINNNCYTKKAEKGIRREETSGTLASQESWSSKKKLLVPETGIGRHTYHSTERNKQDFEHIVMNKKDNVCCKDKCCACDSKSGRHGLGRVAKAVIRDLVISVHEWN